MKRSRSLSHSAACGKPTSKKSDYASLIRRLENENDLNHSHQLVTNLPPRGSRPPSRHQNIKRRVSRSFVPDTTTSTSSPEGIRVLSLDGGGVRGLSSLLILRELMYRIRVRRSTRRTASATSEPPRPCDVFDLIVGTGTGGISSLLLVRMHLSVQEAIDEYTDMVWTVFATSTFTSELKRLPMSFGHEAFETYLHKVVEKYLDANSLIFDPAADPRCRATVPAATRSHAGAPPFVFSTCSAIPSFKLANVARATCATAGLFPAVSLDNPPISFLDAGFVGFNNPTEIALEEARKILPMRDVNAVVSLGTGSQKIVEAGRLNNLAEISELLIESCEAVETRVFQSLSHLSYFRFNVNKGLEDIGLEEWEQTSLLAEVTSGYIDSHSKVKL